MLLGVSFQSPGPKSLVSYHIVHIVHIYAFRIHAKHPATVVHPHPEQATIAAFQVDINQPSLSFRVLNALPWSPTRLTTRRLPAALDPLPASSQPALHPTRLPICILIVL